MKNLLARVVRLLNRLLVIAKHKPWFAGIAGVGVVVFVVAGVAFAQHDQPTTTQTKPVTQKQSAPKTAGVSDESSQIASDQNQPAAAPGTTTPAAKPAAKDFDIALTASALTVPVGGSSEGFTASTTDGRAVMWSFEKTGSGVGYYAAPGMLPGAKQTATSSVWSKATAVSNATPGTYTLTVIATVPGTTTTKRKTIAVNVTPAPSFDIEFGDVSGDADASQIVVPFYVVPKNGHSAPISSVGATVVQCNPGIAVASAVYTGATTGKITLSVADSVVSPLYCTIAVTVGSQTYVGKDTFSFSD